MAVAHRISPLHVPLVAQARRALEQRSVPRLAAIDVARGTAMVFVCLSHFAATCLAPGQTGLRDLMIRVSMIATPTFVIISGMTTGCLGAMYPAHLPHLRRLLLDRGLFLLTVGHLLLACALLGSHSFASAVAMGFDTDAIAIAVIAGPVLVDGLSGSARAVTAGVLYLASWASIAAWSPHGAVAVLFKFYAFGILAHSENGLPAAVFPVLPWFAIYLFGTILGEHLGRHLGRGDSPRARRDLFCLACCAAAAGLALYCVRQFAVSAAAAHAPLLVQFLSPTSKLPPGLAYVLYFGGTGLLAVWAMVQLEASGRASGLIQLLRNAGQASLLVFVLQEYEYFTLLSRWAHPYTSFWPLLFVISLLPLCIAAAVWCRLDGNRLLTLGVRAYLERRTRELDTA